MPPRVVPIDYDDLTFVRMEPGRGFLESSTMLWQRSWRHERILEAAAGGCRLTDRVSFIPRMPLFGPVFRLAFRVAFANRHRNLRRRFGDATRVP